MGNSITAVLSCLVSFCVFADPRLDDYPGVELVSVGADNSVESHRVILGSLKKINNVVEPEQFDYVLGNKGSKTFSVPEARSGDLIRDFYRLQLTALGEILFECSGRTCGSSNYWANTVFVMPVLYGPEQFQHYLLGRLKSGDYIAVYVAMRGTKKVYVHIETIKKNQIRQGLARSVFLTSAAAVSAAQEMLDKNKDLILHVVVHQEFEEGKSMAYLIKESKQIGDNLKALLDDSDRVFVHGLGALAPSQSEGVDRIELLMIRR